MSRALQDEFAFARRAVYLGAADALVVADVHLGRDERSDVQLPLGERADVLDRLGALLERFAPATVVVAGDLLHAFDRVPPRVEETLGEFADAVAAAGADLVVTPGNHDALLGEVFDGPAPEEFRAADGTLVCHGHERPPADAPRVVAGHDHPTVEIEGQRHPCFLYGPDAHGGADVLVVPAFSRLAPGTPVNGRRAGEFMSPLLEDGVGRFRPVVYDDGAGEPLAFPPLAELREYL